jgi:hypothetical protein
MSKKQDIIIDNGWGELLSHAEKRSPQRNSSAFCVFRGIFQLNCLPTQTNFFLHKVLSRIIILQAFDFPGSTIQIFQTIAKTFAAPN